MRYSFVTRLRAHSAGLEGLLERLAEGNPGPEELHTLAQGPLSLLAAAVSERMPARAAVVGVLPVRLLPDVAETCEKARAHRAWAEAEILEFSCPVPATVGAIDQLCEVLGRLLREAPGATARIDEPSLVALAEGAGLPVEGAAARLASHGVTEVRRIGAGGPHAYGPLPVHEVWEAPAEITMDFLRSLFEGKRRPLSFVQGESATGIQLLRAAALVRLVGHHPITVVGGDELKGPDAALCFGADRMEAQLDPAGTMGSRTRAYGEAAIRGAQREPEKARRRSAEKKVAHILDEDVDPALLPGGESKSLEVLP